MLWVFSSHCQSLMPLPADLNRVLDDSSTLDDDTRKALKRRLNPAVDLAAAAEDRLTADGYGLAHNPVRSEVVSTLALKSMAICGGPTQPHCCGSWQSVGTSPLLKIVTVCGTPVVWLWT